MFSSMSKGRKPKNECKNVKKPKLVIKNGYKPGFRPNTSLQVRGLYSSKTKNTSKYDMVSSKNSSLKGLSSFDGNSLPLIFLAKHMFSPSKNPQSGLSIMKFQPVRNPKNIHKSIDKDMPSYTHDAMFSPMSIKVTEKKRVPK